MTYIAIYVVGINGVASCLRRRLNPLAHDRPHMSALHIQPPLSRPFRTHLLAVVCGIELEIIATPILTRSRAKVTDNLLRLGELLDGRQGAVLPIVLEIDIDDSSGSRLLSSEIGLGALENYVPGRAGWESGNGATGKRSAGAQGAEAG